MVREREAQLVFFGALQETACIHAAASNAFALPAFLPWAFSCATFGVKLLAALVLISTDRVSCSVVTRV